MLFGLVGLLYKQTRRFSGRLAPRKNSIVFFCEKSISYYQPTALCSRFFCCLANGSVVARAVFAIAAADPVADIIGGKFMKMITSENMVFLGVNQLKAKATGNPFELVQLVDEESYEKFEFFRRDDLVLTGVYPKDKVICEFEMTKRGFDNVVNLVSVVKA